MFCPPRSVMNACPDGRDNIPPGRLICPHITHVAIFVKKNICCFSSLVAWIFFCLFKFTRSAGKLWIAWGEGPYHYMQIHHNLKIFSKSNEHFCQHEGKDHWLKQSEVSIVNFWSNIISSISSHFLYCLERMMYWRDQESKTRNLRHLDVA